MVVRGPKTNRLGGVLSVVTATASLLVVGATDFDGCMPLFTFLVDSTSGEERAILVSVAASSLSDWNSRGCNLLKGDSFSTDGG